ncbi:MAG: magnesium protoporphyrin IX methyltransferase [Myxococcota bacterium]
MDSATYRERRGQLETYFDRTASDAWTKLTSDAPVSRIRATVRAGRDAMQAILLSWLPEDLDGARILDAGCGTGTLSMVMARRGASVVATDLSASLVDIARQRASEAGQSASIDFRVGDMLDPTLGGFDWVVAMDSLIHYEEPDMVHMVDALGARAERGVLFTHAPKTPMLAAMHWVGGFFPRSDRAPAIAPVASSRLAHKLTELGTGSVGRTDGVSRGFYISSSMEWIPR